MLLIKTFKMGYFSTSTKTLEKLFVVSLSFYCELYLKSCDVTYAKVKTILVVFIMSGISTKLLFCYRLRLEFCLYFNCELYINNFFSCVIVNIVIMFVFSL